MKRWTIEAVDRQTGRVSTVTVVADSQEVAIATVNDRGLLAGKVLGVEDANDEVSAVETSANDLRPTIQEREASQQRDAIIAALTELRKSMPTEAMMEKAVWKGIFMFWIVLMLISLGLFLALLLFVAVFR